MPISQNVRFRGDATPDDEVDHPGGLSIAKLLRSGLSQCGWAVTDLDNWRDGGWSIICEMSGAKLDVVVAKLVGEPEWMLQIAPSYSPGVIGRLLLKKSDSASPVAILVLAKDVHKILANQGGFTDFKWCWGGYPEEDTSTPTPNEYDEFG
jgi:hypothetical protein